MKLNHLFLLQELDLPGFHPSSVNIPQSDRAPVTKVKTHLPIDFDFQYLIFFLTIPAFSILPRLVVFRVFAWKFLQSKNSFQLSDIISGAHIQPGFVDNIERNVTIRKDVIQETLILNGSVGELGCS